MTGKDTSGVVPAAESAPAQPQRHQRHVREARHLVNLDVQIELPDGGLQTATLTLEDELVVAVGRWTSSGHRFGRIRISFGDALRLEALLKDMIQVTPP